MMAQEQGESLISKAVSAIKQIIAPKADEDLIVGDGISEPIVTFPALAGTGTPVRINDDEPQKTVTIAANESITITYTHNSQEWLYTLSSDTAQTLDISVLGNNALCIKGANLSVQSGDGQSSKIYLLGDENTLKIGTKGKTLNADKIGYLADAGGDMIWTENNNPTTYALELSRGDAEQTLDISGEEQIILLKNPFTGSNYTYTVKSNNNNSTVTTIFEFLANGRLVVTGSHLNITAGNNQQDDLIILGDNNKIYTNDQDDTIRIGWVTDGGYNLSTKGNTINAGDGNDYLLLKTNNMDYEIDMGDGNDYTQLFKQTSTAYSSTEKTYFNAHTINSEHMGLANLHNNHLYLNIVSSNEQDNLDGWTTQYASGDCAALALINSLGQCTNNGNLSKYITITKNGSSYTVVFKNYNSGPNTVEITEEYLKDNDSFVEASGDIDTMIFLAALEKLTEENNPTWKNDNSTILSNYTIDGHHPTVKEFIEKKGLIAYLANFKQTILTDYIFGNNHGRYEYHTANYTNTYNENDLINSWAHYLNGDISNMIVSFKGTSNTHIGLLVNHAYSVKNIAQDSFGEYYIELVNPWNDADYIRFNLSDILNNKDAEMILFYYGHSKEQIRTSFEPLNATS